MVPTLQRVTLTYRGSQHRLCRGVVNKKAPGITEKVELGRAGRARGDISRQIQPLKK